MKAREIVAILELDGWRLVRVRRSHHHYKHPSTPGVVTVPGSGGDDLSPGTLRSIYKQAGLDRPNVNREV